MQHECQSSLVFDKEGQPMSEAKVGTVVEAKTPREAPSEEIGREQTTVNGQSQAPRSVRRRPEQSARKPASGFQRTTSVIRTLLPLVQKVLPLLEGNFASVAVNLLAPRLQGPPVDIHPIEVGLARLRAEIAELHEKNEEHDAAFKRIGQDMESVKDTLERTSFEQKQRSQELSRLGTRMTIFSVVVVLLLIASLVVDAVLLLRVQQVLH
jgi:hypothetical protein